MLHYVWPCITALLAGIINAVAGGGTLLSFPALVSFFQNLKPEDLGHLAEPNAAANATSTIALFPSTLTSAWAYRQELATVWRRLKLLVPPSIVGGALGALLVIWFPSGFKQIVPWLILTAAFLFTIQPAVTKWLGHTPTKTPSSQRIALVIVMQFLVAVYGGYFGAGIGILMLSALGFMGMSDLHEMNSLKVVMGACINGTAVAVFMVKDLIADGSPDHPHYVHWPVCLAMIGTALIGGYVGAKYARLIPGKYIRYFVIAVGFASGIYKLMVP